MMNEDYFDDLYGYIPDDDPPPPPSDMDMPPDDPDDDPLRYRVPPDAPIAQPQPRQPPAQLPDTPTAQPQPRQPPAQPPAQPPDPPAPAPPPPPPPTDADAADPVWLIRKKTGNDICGGTFVEEFAALYDIRCVGGRFYEGDNGVADDALKKKIYTDIKPYAKITAQRVTSILALLAIETESPAPPALPNCIYFKNCTLSIGPSGACADDGDDPDEIIVKKHPRQPVSLCRVPHYFNENVGKPTRFLAFLSELFAPDDIPTLQQYLGYCLMPSTKAQKALFIIGKGGEGKSRLTMLMKKVLGKACVISSISRIGERFFGTAIEHRLLFIDDDLCCDKFHATDTFKTLVTNENDATVEPKGKAYYETCHYARFFLMGNQSVGSLHDRSEGFYRRVHIINTKPRDKNRAHNPMIMEQIWAEEQAEILTWLVWGAHKLVAQNYILTESEASRAELKALRQSDNTALEFLQEQRFTYGEGCSITSQQLTAKYKEWCFDNDLFKVGGQVFKKTCDAYFEEGGGVYVKNLSSHMGRVRGYKGVRIDF